MRRRSCCHGWAALLFIIGISLGSAQLNTLDTISPSGQGSPWSSLAYYARNFVTRAPATCVQSTDFSPYRVYFVEYNQSVLTDTATWVFRLDVDACRVKEAYCCSQALDHLVIRTVSTVTVKRVTINDVERPATVGPKGITINNVGINPSSLSNNLVVLETGLEGFNYIRDLCPYGRYSSGNERFCDVIAYNQDEACCPERAALYYAGSPPPPPPGTNTGNDTRPTSPPLPPSPRPPSPPNPPPPPPDGWDLCCMDDLLKSPYNLKYHGYERRGSDTAYKFQLEMHKVDPAAVDLDGPEYGDCAEMSFRDIGVAIYDYLLIKDVQFNGTIMSYWTEPTGVYPDANWVYINLFKTLADFDTRVPIDLVITVRGKVDSLCPANQYLYSPAACEFVIHGKDADTHCCPHGATKRGPGPDECCVDDFEKAPYRMQYLNTAVDDWVSTYDFAIKVVTVSNNDIDVGEEALCDHMTLDSAQIQIYKHIEVLEVTWEQRIMEFNTTPATDYSKWLHIKDINRFLPDFDPNAPTKFKITVRGFVRELCPAGWLLGAGGKPICEYVLHGVQGNHTCCPHQVTEASILAPDCGCRDDEAGTPYRLGYSLMAEDPSHTMFNFDMGKVDPNALKDVDGAPDRNFGVDVDCSEMTVKYITLAVHKDVEVEAVIFNGFNYTFQFEPYTDEAKWLKVLDLDYSPSDFPDKTTIPLQILTTGSCTELCPASSLFASQSSCEYYVFGKSLGSECCPRSTTTWTTPNTFGRR